MIPIMRIWCINNIYRVWSRRKIGRDTLLFFFSFLLIIHASEDKLLLSSPLTAEDGLSLNVVTEIVQDSRGFMWIGTYNGLNRYDGYSFKLFFPDPADSQSISDLKAITICEDKEGYIWVGTQKGLNRYDRKTEKFRRYMADSLDPGSINHNSILCIYEDSEDNLWVGTSAGLNKYNREDDTFTSIKKVSDEFNENGLNSVTGITEDLNGNLWLGTWKGLTCFRNNGNIFFKDLPPPLNPNTFRYNQISSVVPDKDNNLWVGTDAGQGLYKYNIEKDRFVHYFHETGNSNSLSDNNIEAIHIDKQGNIWIGTGKGLNKFIPETDSFLGIFNNPIDNTTISNDEIYSITEDRTGLLWIGTQRGIAKAYQTHNNFNYLRKTKWVADQQTISGRRINTVLVDSKNNIWLGTKNGLDKVLKNTKTVIHYTNIPGKQNSLSDNEVMSLAEDKNGYIWIGTNSGGLNKFNPFTGKFTLYSYNDVDENTISNNGIISLCIDSRGILWAGSWWGLNRYNPESDNFTRFSHFADNTCWVIKEDYQGKLWIGTDGGGFNRFDPADESFNNFSDNSDQYKISSNRGISIHQTADSLIWLGTTDGLNLFDPERCAIKIYTKLDGLPSNVINSIYSDKYGNLWITTDKGLSKFDIKNRLFHNFGKRNGLVGLDFTPNTSDMDDNGNIYFGSTDGLLYFDPDSINEKANSAPVVFTDLKIYNESVPITNNDDAILNESISTASEVRIPYSSDVITFEFALLDYFNVKRHQFMYKLESFDKTWTDIGSRNSATYTNLPPGQYRFYVRASNNIGFADTKETSILITILPAYYQTWWFRFIVIVGAVLSVILFIQIRVSSVTKQNKLLEKKVNERTKDLDKTIAELNQEISTKNKFFSIIAHDLRSPFTALLGFSKHLVDDAELITKDDLKIISQSIYKSASLTYSLLENLLYWARIQTGKIDFNPEDINLAKIIRNAVELYWSNAKAKNIDIAISVNGNGHAYADPYMTETIVRNLISNSIKFTEEGGKINCTLKDNEKYLTVTVKDTGVGIAKEKIDKLFRIGYNISTNGTQSEKGSGLGLILCKEFIEFNKGKIEVESEPGNGTEISFTLLKNNSSNKF